MRFVLVGVLAGAMAVLACAAQAAKDEPAEAGEFWTADRMHTMHIRITPAQWRAMQPTNTQRGMMKPLDASSVPRPAKPPSTRPVLAPQFDVVQRAYNEGDRLPPNFYGREFAYVKAAFECDGIKLQDVGLKLHGNSSYNWARDGHNRPYKFDFNRFVEGQEFQGLIGFEANNNAYDPSLMRETLAYEMFREFGVPAPRTTLAMLYLSIAGETEEECLGIYTLVEEIDSKAFLNNHFGSAKGMLTKPYSIRGLPYMGELWSGYEERYNTRTKATEQAARRTIDFIRLVNYADDQTFGRQIEEYLDVVGFLRLLTGEVVLANLDSPLHTGHNFYMYLNPEDDRFCLMPWDMNLAFANYTTVASGDQLVLLSIMNPHTGEAKIVDRLLAIPHYRQMYQDDLRQLLATYFNREKLFARIDTLQAVLDKADAAADEVWKSKFAKPTVTPGARAVRIPPRPVAPKTGWQGRPSITMKDFVTRRIDSINAQLAGQNDGFIPGGRRGRVGPLRGGPERTAVN